jgi:tetratricopeptide (TPR) repeat protein
VLGEVTDAQQIARRVAELTGIAEGASAPGEAFWAVRRFLEAYAADGPVVVALDDIHWAEPTLLDLVEYLGEWGEGPLLVVCAARRELLETRPGWAGPTSTGFVVELEPLGGDEVSSLITRLSEEPLDPKVEERIVEHAGGNPLFAEQLVALTAEAPELALDDPPPTVEALIASRLDRLDPGELAVVRRASVVGRRFSQAELDDVTPAQEKEQTRRDLAGLSQRALVHPANDLFRFHHVLVRDVAYRGIPKVDRADLHELAAKGFDRRDGPDEVVGYHFEQAFGYLKELGRPDDHALELAAAGGERLGRAGIRAWKRADSPAAVNLLTRSLELTPAAHDLACELGLALFVGGRVEEAKTVVARVADAPDSSVAARGRLELAHLRSVGEPDLAGELIEAASAAIPLLEAAGDERGLGRAWLSLAHVRGGFYCQYAITEEAARRAVEHYRRAGWSPSTALNNLGAALYLGPTPVQEAVAQCAVLLRDHEGDHASEANVTVWLAGLEGMRGAFETARTDIGRAEARYLELGLTTAAIDDCGRLLGAVEMLAGAPDRAEEALRRCCKTLKERQQTQVLATRAGELAEALYAQARYDEAGEWTRLARESAGADDFDAALSWQPIEARLLARRGAVEEAERLARETLELAARTDALNRTANVYLALAEILRSSGRDHEAASAVRSALDLYERKGNAVSADHARNLLLEGFAAAGQMKSPGAGLFI